MFSVENWKQNKILPAYSRSPAPHPCSLQGDSTVRELRLLLDSLKLQLPNLMPNSIAVDSPQPQKGNEHSADFATGSVNEQPRQGLGPQGGESKWVLAGIADGFVVHKNWCIEKDNMRIADYSHNMIDHKMGHKHFAAALVDGARRQRNDSWLQGLSKGLGLRLRLDIPEMMPLSSLLREQFRKHLNSLTDKSAS
ncbi:hypothetical protein L6164_003627 [Bauhinia variegata]|uniref:Uncharacterized protein n=1 Tax=Bauhinia variegata TaxID=167791 RepID=A0ACB9Q3D9_BAUVA|nr:hypothetical protein L6164_003627 [Bauhinia variegata]